MPDQHSAPRRSAHAAWGALPPAGPRRGVAEPPDNLWAGLEGAPLVEVLRAVYAAGFAEGRRSREQ